MTTNIPSCEVLSARTQVSATRAEVALLLQSRSLSMLSQCHRTHVLLVLVLVLQQN